MLLNEMFPNVQYDCQFNYSDPYTRYKITVTVDNDSFTGSVSKQCKYRKLCMYLFHAYPARDNILSKQTWWNVSTFPSYGFVVGSSKKIAKNAAATAALTKLASPQDVLKVIPNIYGYSNKEDQEKADTIGRFTSPWCSYTKGVSLVKDDTYSKIEKSAHHGVSSVDIIRIDLLIL
ncbi:hypothetical protein NQ317_011389 [Molorchus minor]|uniref:DRBM domain-containing protein n=1 Tax=Molorchus minor TaxID=1323400 RepID=A0ABQ9JSD7_9CUCU|nr:hypothetical protein NQ317_011389 [Molorchus minor]